MRSNVLVPISNPFPSSSESFYRELTARNRHFVSPRTQEKLRALKFLVAGCGSTGGACIESAARLGVENFALADNGAYELNNLNRQHALLENLGESKAVFHARQLAGINPFIKPIVHSEGISESNVKELASWADLIMDAVDVTSASGIQMKLRLHEEAQRLGKPVMTALDIGFCQWGRSYDYRDRGLRALDGNLERARAAKHPLKALFSIVPLSAVPDHSLHLIEELLVSTDCSASQLGGTSDLLSGIIPSALIRFAETSQLVPGWNINTEALALPFSARLALRLRSPARRLRVSRLLRKTA